MAKVRKRRRLLRDLSLKWSFGLYVLLCIAAALISCALTISLFSAENNAIWNHYESLYHDDIAVAGQLTVNGEVVDDEGIWFYTRSVQSLFSSEDLQRYHLNETLMVLSVPVNCFLCLLGTGWLFYRRKLHPPLALFDQASTKIAEGDLGFSIAYDSRNEMGRMARSFETMRASLEHTHRQMWRMAEERKRLNQAFAHDLRTPLTVLKGYVDYLHSYVPQGRVSQEKLLSTLDMMGQYIGRLEGYTISMSSLQKLEEIEPQLQPIVFDALAEQLRQTAEMLCGKEALDFAAEGQGSLLADADLVTQVAENLLANAKRYASHRVAIRCMLKDGLLCLTVSDDGPGFSREAREKAASPYYHEQTEDLNADHFGLGLYVCTLLCHKLGGKLILPLEEGSSQVIAVFQADRASTRNKSVPAR